MRFPNHRESFILRIALFLFALGACVAPSAASAATGHEYEKSFGPDGTSATQFIGPGAVAVDQASHEIYVADRPGSDNVVSKFDQNGNTVNFTAGPGAGTNDISGFSFLGSELGTTQIAVNSTTHDFYVADLGNDRIEAFHPNGGEAEFIAGPGAGSNQIPAVTAVCGVAVDADGAIYMGDKDTGVHVFAPDGEELTSFADTQACNVAVDSQGTVYVAHYAKGLGSVEKFTPSEFPVSAATEYSAGGVVDPGPAYAITVDPTSDELYVVKHPAGKTNTVQYDENGEIVNEFGESGSGALTSSEGIAVDGATEKVYASDAKGEQQAEIFAPAPEVPPTVGSTTAADITSTSATLRAQVNPNHYRTEYHFEYLTEADYVANGETFAGAQSTPETNLGSAGQPQSANAHVGGLAPDTAYRFRVVAENENGEATSPEPAPRFATFAAFPPGLPDGRAYELVSPPQKVGEVYPPFQGVCEACLPGGTDIMTAMQSSPDGEAVVYEGRPFFAGLAPEENEYMSSRSPSGWGTQALSSSLITGTYQAFSADLSRGVLLQEQPALSPEAPTQGGKAFRNLYLRDESGSLQPLVAIEPTDRTPKDFRLAYAGANAGTASASAFSHVIFEANDALTPEISGVAPAAPEVEANNSCVRKGETCNLYEWVDGQLRLINVLPGNAQAADGAVIGSGYRFAPTSAVAAEEAKAVDRAISDDGSRIFWSEEENGQAYVRIDGKETKKIEDPGSFLTASADGSKVLLGDGCLYDLEAGECEADLSEGQGGFEGILGAAEDLSRVYFVDTAILSGENAEGKSPLEGEFNLYAWDKGATAFIGALAAADDEISGLNYGDWHASRANRTAQVTPGGRYLAFMSQAPLTGYDNNLGGGGKCKPFNPTTSACYEVFAYDAATATLTCASCNPTGQRPLGGSRLSLIRSQNVPHRQPGNLSADGQGRLFFESEDVLSPYDTNGSVQDVYQWEPNGVGSCKRVGGCVRLISSGHSPFVTLFLDSSESGDDAFIVTREQLVLADRNEQLDLFDVRVNGGIAAETETLRSECQGEACQPAAVVPNDATPSSASFSGTGNVTEKAKKKQRKKKHKRRHAKRHHRGRAASHSRGGVK